MFNNPRIFVGDVVKEGSGSVLNVERALPVWPLMTEKVPSEHTLDTLTRRLRQELDRRGLTLPVIPERPPEPTEGAKLRRFGYGTTRRASVD